MRKGRASLSDLARREKGFGDIGEIAKRLYWSPWASKDKDLVAIAGSFPLLYLEAFPCIVAKSMTETRSKGEMDDIMDVEEVLAACALEMIIKLRFTDRIQRNN